ncbi:TOMM precursor leader peptide-binding protein [Herbiconiux sp. P16]|uniref:TOMM precursor leader peptide-binding protein n=1 Tax=Herbiconiux wuyangfengii TaxID=3342794 RepID=UPI0035BB3690
MIAVHMVTLGEFAADLVDALPKSWREQRTTDSESAARPDLWPTARLQIVITQREDARLFEIMDESAFNLQRPWVPVVMEPRSIRVGPQIVPGVGACYACFVRRQYQHGRRTTTDRELAALSDRSGATEQRGYLPAHISATGQLLRSLAAPLLSVGPPRDHGRLFRLGFAELSVNESAVIAIHGCGRCGRADDGEQTWRSLEQLTSKVKAMRWAF